MTHDISLVLMSQTKNSTLSGLWHGDEFLGFIIEDGFNEKKVYGETRIPGGRFKLRKKTDGEFFKKYSQRYGHKFVIEIVGVPNFSAILIHIGNWIRDTKGCLLTNNQAGFDENNDSFYGIDSVTAYKNFYNYIAPLMDSGDVWINIDRGQLKAA